MSLKYIIIQIYNSYSLICYLHLVLPTGSRRGLAASVWGCAGDCISLRLLVQEEVRQQKSACDLFDNCTTSWRLQCLAGSTPKGTMILHLSSNLIKFQHRDRFESYTKMLLELQHFIETKNNGSLSVLYIFIEHQQKVTNFRIETFFLDVKSRLQLMLKLYMISRVVNMHLHVREIHTRSYLPCR